MAEFFFVSFVKGGNRTVLDPQIAPNVHLEQPIYRKCAFCVPLDFGPRPPAAAQRLRIGTGPTDFLLGSFHFRSNRTGIDADAAALTFLEEKFEVDQRFECSALKLVTTLGIAPRPFVHGQDTFQYLLQSTLFDCDTVDFRDHWPGSRAGAGLGQRHRGLREAAPH
jgi:hypothetical protein